MAVSPENPFPAKAVTTFGSTDMKFADLAFMRRSHRVLLDYLKAYPAEGPTLALSGGHGTGKTYLLAWLAAQATELQSAPARLLYAKTNGPDLVEAYRELIRNLTRRHLLEVVNAALLSQGTSRVGAAMATQVESSIIEETGSMESAFEGRVLDSNELHLELRKALESRSVASAVSQKVAYAIGLIEDAQYGEAAFDWIEGKAADLPNESLRAPLFSQDIDSSQVAVDALETIAALFKAADYPLVILLDQVENFVPRDGVANASSIIKKLGEQLNKQSAMLVMAGTPPAWEHLPRDLWHRFHGRRPFPVGNLSVEETEALLRAYLGNTGTVSRDLAQRLNDLSGGNSREILQIAHRAWEIVDGKFETLTPEDLNAAALDAGSLEDRTELARQMLQEIVASEQLEMWRGPATDDDVRIWVVEAKSGSRVGVAMVLATDSRAEAQLAHRITTLRRQLDAEESVGDIVVVTIGYSSERVQSLLSGASRTIVFRETSFKETLQAEIDSVLSAAPRVEPSARPELEKQLVRLERALAEVERGRELTEKQRSELVAQQTGAVAAAEREDTQVKTRIQLREGLDDLADTLTKKKKGDERKLLRRLLIDNESYVQNQDFDYLGNLYLDTLDMLRLGPGESAEAPGGDFTIETERLRANLITAMRNEISATRRRFVDSRSWRVFVSVAGGVWIAASIYSFFALDYTYEGGMVEVVLTSFIAGCLSGAFLFAYLETLGRPEFRHRSYRARLRRIRSAFRVDAVLSS